MSNDDVHEFILMHGGQFQDVRDCLKIIGDRLDALETAAWGRDLAYDPDKVTISKSAFLLAVMEDIRKTLAMHKIHD